LNKLTIYVKDAKQRDELQERHPDIDADFINMSQQTELHDMMPMVCINEKGKERCEIGEDFIETLGGK
jgi:hypothetical protein